MKIHRTTAATTLVALAFVALTSCATPAPDPADAPAPPAAAPAEPGEGTAGEAPSSAAPAEPGGDAAGEAPPAALGQAATAVAGMAALGGLGQDQGDGEQVRGLGGQMVTDAQAMTEQLRAQGVTQVGRPTAEQQALLADLGARSGQPFDQAWLRAATDALAQARSAAEAVLASAEAGPEARAAAEQALARLDALSAGLVETSTAAGAGTPDAVDAGTGGQAAQDAGPVLALGLLGAGVALIGGAAWRRHRTS